MAKKTQSPIRQSQNGKWPLSRIVAIICIVILIANILLFSFMIYSALVMWIVIIIAALIAFPGMKWLRKREAKNRKK